jgi:hypothetical protein
MAPFRAAFVSTMGLAFILASSADAAPARKLRQSVAAPTKIMVYSKYRGANLFPPGPVMYGYNEYLGDDPDPFIRLQLMRDLGAHFGGNF